MSKKKEQEIRPSTLAANLLLDHLNTIEGITSKGMFGGYGIFHEGKMFAIVSRHGHFFFKANDDNRPDYEAHNAEQHSRMPYFRLPEHLLEDRDELCEWALRAIAVNG